MKNGYHYYARFLKFFIAMSLVVLCQLSARSSSANWLWAKGGGENSAGDGVLVGTDAAGNVYISGNYIDYILLDTFLLSSNGGSSFFNCFLIKMDPAGNILWARTSSCTNDCTMNGMCVDAAGNVYLGGDFDASWAANGTVTFGGTTLTSNGDYNGFLVKYNTWGNVVWAKGLGGAKNQVQNVTVNPAGHVFICGIYNSDCTIGTITLTPGPNNDSFIAELDSNANALWAQSTPSDNWVDVYGIGADANGNSYMSGYAGGTTITFGSVTIPASSYCIFLAKFDGNGNCLWATCTTSTGGIGNKINWNTAMAVDAIGNAYLTGYVETNIDFGNSVTLSGATANDYFIAKYDPNGKAVWASIEVDSLGSIGYGVATDAKGNVYTTGYFGGPYAIFNGVELTSNEDGTSFIVEYDSSGNVKLALNPVGNVGETGEGIAIDATGNILLSGSGESTVLAFGQHTINLNDENDPFIAKYGVGTSQPGANFIANDTAVCAGSSVNFTDQSTGSPTAWVWTFTGGTPGTSSLPNPTVTYNQPGTYPVKLWVSNATGIDSLTKGGYIIVKPLPVAGGITGPAIVCAGSSVQLSDTGSSGSLQWQYSADGISFSTIAGDTTSTNNITALPDSAYYRVMATNGCGTDSSAVYQLPVDSLPVPVVTAADTIICSGDSTQVCTSTTYSSYLWNTSDTTHCTSATAAGGYWLTVTDANHCSAVSNHAQVSVYPVPSVSIIVEGDTLSSFGQTHYQWIKDGVPIDSATSAVYVAHQSGDYAVQVTDTNGCTTTSEAVTVTGLQDITRGEGVSVYPNPNSTGSWQLVVDNSLVGSKLELYDDEGRIVFQSATSNQKSELRLNVPPGVYLLQIMSENLSIVKKMVVL